MNAGQRRIEAISLDVDGTLYSIRRMVLRHLPTLLPVRRFFRTLHRVRDQMRGLGPVADFRSVQAERLGEALGISPEQAAARVEAVIDRRWMQLFDRLQPFPGVVETLRSLAGRGLKLAVLSDYPAWPKLAGLGLAQLPFAVVVNTEQVGALKPHPAGFELVSQRLGVDPEATLHVGDLEHNDVLGAQATGMLAARFYEGKRPDTQALFAFCDWRRLAALLRFKGLLA